MKQGNEWPPALVTPGSRDHLRDGTITSKYTTRPAPRNRCRACGTLSHATTCRACCAWAKVWTAHRLMTAALAEVHRGR